MTELGPVVALSGPTGSGKTALALELRKRGQHVVLERISDATQDPPPCGSDQVRIQRESASAKIRALARRPATEPTFLDRSPGEDRDVFLTLHLECGHLTHEEAAALAQAPEFVVTDRGVDAAVVLRTPPNILCERLLERGAPDWLLDSLLRQINLYETWVTTLRCPKLLLDSSVFSVPDLADRAQSFVRKVTEDRLSGKRLP